MIKRVAAWAFIGWTGIVGLAWWLAARRIEICGDAYYSKACVLRATAARDSALIWGLSIGLAGAVFFALILARRNNIARSHAPGGHVELHKVGQAPHFSRPFDTRRLGYWLITAAAIAVIALAAWRISVSRSWVEADLVAADSPSAQKPGPFDRLASEQFNYEAAAENLERAADEASMHGDP